MATELSLIEIGSGEARIAMAMTPAAFDRAQEADVTGITADTDAMQRIAQEAEFLEEGEPLPPLLIVARDSHPSRKTIGRYDTSLPVDDTGPRTGRYFSAADIAEAHPPSGNRERLVAYARHIGAGALTEVSIRDWTPDEARRSHAAAFAGGLITGQRPLDLPGRSLVRLGREWLHTLGDTKRFDRVNARAETLPLPFVIQYGRNRLPPA